MADPYDNFVKEIHTDLENLHEYMSDFNVSTENEILIGSIQKLLENLSDKIGGVESILPKMRNFGISEEVYNNRVNEIRGFREDYSNNKLQFENVLNSKRAAIRNKNQKSYDKAEAYINNQFNQQNQIRQENDKKLDEVLQNTNKILLNNHIIDDELKSSDMRLNDVDSHFDRVKMKIDKATNKLEEIISDPKKKTLIMRIGCVVLTLLVAAMLIYMILM